jgi:hypothetical protein
MADLERQSVDLVLMTTRSTPEKLRLCSIQLETIRSHPIVDLTNTLEGLVMEMYNTGIVGTTEAIDRIVISVEVKTEFVWTSETTDVGRVEDKEYRS